MSAARRGLIVFNSCRQCVGCVTTCEDERHFQGGRRTFCRARMLIHLQLGARAKIGTDKWFTLCRVHTERVCIRIIPGTSQTQTAGLHFTFNSVCQFGGSTET